jgi:hypothetical protein
MRQVTDPSLIDQLESSSRPVDDPALIQELEDAPSDVDLLGEVGGALEVGGAVVSGAIAEPVAGLAGLAATPFVGAERGAEIVENVSDAMTYRPDTPEGRRNLEAAANFLKPIGEIMQKAEQISGDAGYDLAGPIGGALASTLPAAVIELLGLKGARKVSKIPDPVRKVDLGTAPGPDDLGQMRDAFRKGDVDTVADSVDADPDILGAAEELQVDINPGASSQNRTFIESEQSLKSRPGSLIGAREEKSIRDLGERADTLINDLGGTTDKSLLDAKVRDDYLQTIGDLTEKSDALYRVVEDAITPSTKIHARSVRQYLDSKLEDLGGDSSLLTNAEKSLKSMLDGDPNPTYAALDRVRKNVGDGFKRQGPYADDEIGTLEQVYAVLIRDQQKASDVFDVGYQFRAANSLVTRRKQLEHQSIKLYGRDLQGSLVSNLSAAASGLQKGDMGNFRKLMNAVPEHLRGDVAATLLTDLFSAGTRNKASLGGGFAKAYEGLTRNATAKAELFKYLPEGAEQRFDLIGKVATGIYRSKALENTSRTARDIIAAMDDGGMFEKVYSVGKQAAGAEAITSAIGIPGVGSAGVIGAALAKSKTPATQAADALLSSDKFAKAVKAAAIGRGKQADELIKNSRVYKDWVKYLPELETDQITARGFVPWLIVSGHLSKGGEDE